MKKQLGVKLALIFSGLFFVAFNANAGLIRVAQESSAGAGDFDSNVLGYVNAFSTGMTAADYYQYGSPKGASYNGQLNGGPDSVSGLSQIFMVDASDGLSLFVVHDKPSDGSGGKTKTQWNLLGDTAAEVLADDPSEAVTVSAGGTQFNSTKNWFGCCTDGYVIGQLDGSWTMLGQFLDDPNGINAWSVIDSDYSATSLVLENGRRVQLTQVPEPTTLLLLGLGLLGFGASKRKLF